MNAQEMRIGNWYDHNGVHRQVTPNTIEEVWEAKRTWCKPIPITEKWLLDFGFEEVQFKQDLNRNFYKRFEIEKTERLFSISYYIETNKCYFNFDVGYGDNEILISFVNQLQNLYFCLCGEELIIKE